MFSRSPTHCDALLADIPSMAVAHQQGYAIDLNGSKEVVMALVPSQFR
jgi:hypothetical protein